MSMAMATSTSTSIMITADELVLLKRALRDLLDQRDLLLYGQVQWERDDNLSHEDVAVTVKVVKDFLTLLDR